MKSSRWVEVCLEPNHHAGHVNLHSSLYVSIISVSSNYEPGHLQVPIGTSVWLLDKLFARLPELKPQYKEKDHRIQDKAVLPNIDTRISSDYSELHERFAPLRARQMELGLRGVVTLDALAKAVSPHQVGEARQCALLFRILIYKSPPVGML